MMQSKYILAIGIMCLIFGGVLALSGTRKNQSGPAKQAALSSPALAAPVERLDEQTAANARSLKPTATIAPRTPPHLDGLSLVEKHCTRCHTVQWLGESELTPGEWEAALARMEMNGALLSDAERSVLLEYFAPADRLRDPD